MSAVATKDKNISSYIWAISFIVVSMVVPEGFDYEAAEKGMPSASGGFNRILWLALLGFAVYKVYTTLKESKKIFLANRYFVALVVMAIVSYLWSIDPPTTMRRCLRIITIVGTCLAFAATIKSPASFQAALRPAVTFLMVGSIIFVMMDPHHGVEQLTMAELLGAWKGMTTQKNALGALATMGVVLWLHAWMTKQSKLPWPLIGIAASAVCVINSRSSTSIMATLFSVVLMMMLMRSPGSMKRSMPYFVVIFVSVLLIYSLAVLKLVPGSEALLSPIASLTGKDLTFSGRTQIWDIVNEHIKGHPLLGTGYGGYWVGADPASESYEMLLRLMFYPAEAHNGYLDIINDLGYIGEIMLLGYVIVFLRQSLALYKIDRAQGAIYLVLLFHQMIGNMSESMWFNVRVVQFAIMSLATVCLSKSLQLHQMAQVTAYQTPPPTQATPAPTQKQPAKSSYRSAWDRLRNP